MRMLHALAWKEWRATRAHAAAALALLIGLTATAALASLADGAFDVELSAVVQLLVAWPVMALLLGSTLATREPGSELERAQPLDAGTRAAVRLVVRLGVLAALALAGLALLAAGGWNFRPSPSAGLLGELGLDVLLPSWLLGWFSCAALASAWCRRPLSALLAGGAIALGGAVVLRGVAEGLTWSTYDSAPGRLLLALTAWLLLSAAGLACAWRDGREPLGLGSAAAGVALLMTLLLVGCGGWSSVGHARARAELDRARAAWEGPQGSLDALVREIPRRENNPPADRLLELAAALRRSPAAGGRASASSRWTFVDDAARRGPRAAALATSLAPELAGEPEPLREARELLLGGDAPRFAWRALDEGQPRDFRDLHFLAYHLLARAALRAREGRDAEARDDLAAAWRIVEAGWLVPQVSWRDPLIRTTTHAVQLARWIPGVDSVWDARLATLPVARSARDLTHVEALRLAGGLVRLGALPLPRSPFAQAGITLGAPSMAREGADALVALRAWVPLDELLDAPCLAPVPRHPPSRSRHASWIAELRAKAAVLQREIELSRVAIALRQARETGSDPRALVPTAACSGLAWRHEIAPDGTLRAWAEGTDLSWRAPPGS